MKKYIFSVIFSTALVINCGSTTVQSHPTPVVTDTAMCVTADQHLASLCSADSSKNAYCCLVDALTKKGKNYTQFCIEKQNEGVFLNPRCISQVTSCDQIDACTQSN